MSTEHDSEKERKLDWTQSAKECLLNGVVEGKIERLKGKIRRRTQMIDD